MSLNALPWPIPMLPSACTRTIWKPISLRPASLASGLCSCLIKATKSNWPPAREETPHVSIAGYIGKPESAKKTRGEQFFFVNNRYIKNNYLHHAVMKAYAGSAAVRHLSFLRIIH